jgi:hypothetical protein
MLCHYSDTIVPDVKNNITYNDETNLLLNGNLGMSCMKIKKKYFIDVGGIIMMLMLI